MKTQLAQVDDDAREAGGDELLDLLAQLAAVAMSSSPLGATWTASRCGRTDSPNGRTGDPVALGGHCVPALAGGDTELDTSNDPLVRGRPLDRESRPSPLEAPALHVAAAHRPRACCFTPATPPA